MSSDNTYNAQSVNSLKCISRQLFQMAGTEKVKHYYTLNVV